MSNAVSIIFEQKTRLEGHSDHGEQWSTGEFAKKFLLVQAVLEGFAAVDEHHRNFVIVEAAELAVGIHVDLTQSKAAALVELDEAFLDDLTEMTTLPGIQDDLSGIRHGQKV